MPITEGAPVVARAERYAPGWREVSAEQVAAPEGVGGHRTLLALAAAAPFAVHLDVPGFLDEGRDTDFLQPPLPRQRRDGAAGPVPRPFCVVARFGDRWVLADR
jgi:hypothetical protein